MARSEKRVAGSPTSMVQEISLQARNRFEQFRDHVRSEFDDELKDRQIGAT